MKRTIYTFLIAAVIAFIGAVALVAYFRAPKTAFFDYNTVYNKCHLKETLEKELEELTSRRKSELDSMRLELSFLSNKVKAGKAAAEELTSFEDLKNRFLTYQHKYEQENIGLKEQYFSQIRKEIAEKAEQYAEQRGLDYFFTKISDGSLMYGKKGKDLTAEFLEFIDK